MASKKARRPLALSHCAQKKKKKGQTRRLSDPFYVLCAKHSLRWKEKEKKWRFSNAFFSPQTFRLYWMIVWLEGLDGCLFNWMWGTHDTTGQGWSKHYWIALHIAAKWIQTIYGKVPLATNEEIGEMNERLDDGVRQWYQGDARDWGWQTQQNNAHDTVRPRYWLQTELGTLKLPLKIQSKKVCTKREKKNVVNTPNITILVQSKNYTCAGTDYKHNPPKPRWVFACFSRAQTTTAHHTTFCSSPTPIHMFDPFSVAIMWKGWMLSLVRMDQWMVGWLVSCLHSSMDGWMAGWRDVLLYSRGVKHISVAGHFGGPSRQWNQIQSNLSLCP